MGYFTTSQLFLVPSFDLDQNEQDKLDVLLAVLEESGIGREFDTSLKISG